MKTDIITSTIGIIVTAIVLSWLVGKIVSHFEPYSSINYINVK